MYQANVYKIYIDLMASPNIKIKDNRKTYEAKYTLLELLNEGGNA